MLCSYKISKRSKIAIKVGAPSTPVPIYQERFSAFQVPQVGQTARPTSPLPSLKKQAGSASEIQDRNYTFAGNTRS